MTYCELKGQTTIVGCADRDIAAMEQDGIFDDREAKPRAPHVAAAPFVDAIEALEDAGEVFSGNADTIVAEGEVPPVRLLFGSDFDDCPRSCVVDGIVHQIAEDAI